MTHAWANALSLETEAPGVLIDETRLKAPGNQSLPPGTWALPTGSPQLAFGNYDVDAMFPFPVNFLIEIDAHSTGNDQIPDLDAQGIPIVNSTAQNWLAWVVSVDDSTLGASATGYIETTRPNRPIDADLLGYYADQNQGLAGRLAGLTTIEATSISQGFPAASPPNVNSIDFALGVRTFDPLGTGSNLIFTNPVFEYYFSVSAAFADLWQATDFAIDPTINTAPPTTVRARPGDIYRIVWNGTAWSPIERYLRGDVDLGLEPDEDIDALAVNYINDVVAFSTVRGTGDPQFDDWQLRVWAPGMQRFVELQDRLRVTGAPVSVADRLDLAREDNEIDSLCGIDPKEYHPQYDRLVGMNITTTAEIANVPVEGTRIMSVSLTRALVDVDDDGVNDNALVMDASGWPEGVVPQAATVLFYYYAGAAAIAADADPFAAPTNNWQFLGAVDRAATDESVTYQQIFPWAFGDNFRYAVLAVMYSNPTSGPPRMLAGSEVSQVTF